MTEVPDLSHVSTDEVLVNVFRIALRYVIGLNGTQQTLDAIRMELQRLQ